MLILRRWVADRCWNLHEFFIRGWMFLHPESSYRFDRDSGVRAPEVTLVPRTGVPMSVKTINLLERTRKYKENKNA